MIHVIIIKDYRKNIEHFKGLYEGPDVNPYDILSSYIKKKFIEKGVGYDYYTDVEISNFLNYLEKEYDFKEIKTLSTFYIDFDYEVEREHRIKNVE